MNYLNIVKFVFINHKNEKMKIKNNLLKGIIFGICVIVIPLILMGTAKPNSSEIGRYQISTTTIEAEEKYIFITIIDTKNGNITSRKKTNKSFYY